MYMIYLSSGLAGIVGVAFYEGIRIYKCTTIGKHPVPNNRLGWHITGLLLLSIAAVALAISLAHGDFIEGVVLGFGVPSGLKAITARERSNGDGDDNWKHDESNGERNRSVVRKLISWFRSYF